MFKRTKRLEDRISKLERKIKQLECPHPGFKYYTTVINPLEYANIVYKKECKICGKQFYISEKEYLEGKMEKCERYKKSYKDLIEKENENV